MIVLKINRGFLLKNSWHDKLGFTLVFYDSGINQLSVKLKSKDNLLLCVDESDCSSGMFEETDGTLNDIISILNSYGYSSLAKEFIKSVEIYKKGDKNG